VAASLAPRPLAIVHPLDNMENPASVEDIESAMAVVRAAYASAEGAEALQIFSGSSMWNLTEWLIGLANSPPADR